MTIPLSQRFEILQRDGFTCRYCGRVAPETELEVDHIHPRSKGGGDEAENLVTTCRDCNRGKGVRTAVPPGEGGWTSLVGKHFHTFGEDGLIERQGVILARLDYGYFVVLYFEWISGSPWHYGTQVIHMARIAREGWALYATNEEMIDAYEHGGKARRWK